MTLVYTIDLSTANITTWKGLTKLICTELTGLMNWVKVLTDNDISGYTISFAYKMKY